jgi:mono/diheme cytochrome c family protein
MRSTLIWLLMAAVVVAVAFAWQTRPDRLRAADLPAHTPDAANGELVFHAAGCASCHGERLEGGLELHSPFGIFRVPNITPDPVSGIGGWSLLEFANAMVRGVAPDGRHYYPAFPYGSYVRMDLRDVADLKTYLDTFEPVDRRSAPHQLGFPWNVRRGIGLWKRLYLDAGPVAALDALDPELERGRYLVEALGHCGECHTPRNRLGGLDAARWLAGAPHPDGEGRVPNITPADAGLGSWSKRDIAYYLKSGFTPEFDTVGGTMVEVQENLSRLPDADRDAIAAYLRAIPPVADSGD